MPRAKIIRTDSIPYHITSRSNNKEWFYIPIDDVWIYCVKLLEVGKRMFGIQVDAFVLMNNHYHLCVYTPKANFDKFMQFFNRNLGKKISRQAGRINRIFGAPYKWSLIKNENYYFNVVRYIYENPLRAGLVDSCLDYPYSDIMKQGFSQSLLDWFEATVGSKEVTKITKNLRKFVIE